MRTKEQFMKLPTVVLLSMASEFIGKEKICEMLAQVDNPDLDEELDCDLERLN